MSNSYTPLMQQYVDIKEQYPDTILLFQVGDFFELFWDDAKEVSTVLGLTLTKRGTHNGEPIPLCGVPLHTASHYIAKLVKRGYKVALAEQLEEPVPGKLVARAVTRVLTPGTLTDDKLLDQKSASYLCSFFPDAGSCGLLFGELLSAQLFATTVPLPLIKELVGQSTFAASAGRALVESEINRFVPDEILLPESKAKEYATHFKKLGYYTTPVVSEDEGHMRGWLSRHFDRDTNTKITSSNSLRSAMALFHSYLKKNQEAALEQFRTIHFYQPEEFLHIDPASQRNLELVRPMHEGGLTLLSHLDGAATPMGSRTIKKWIQRPLVSKAHIEHRLDAIQACVTAPNSLRSIEQALKEVGDLERVVGRIALRRATPHDYLLLKHALGILPELRNTIQAMANRSTLMSAIHERLADLQQLWQLLEKSVASDNPDQLIKLGFDTHLDGLRDLATNSNTKIMELEAAEIARTGIQSLKIRYNSVHGYYIEITKANYHLIPPDYQRSQTLAGRERFTMPALRQLQGEILAAQQEVKSVETALFEQVKSAVLQQLAPLRHTAQALAHLDGLLGLSLVSYHNSYVRPVFSEHSIHDQSMVIESGKHPVVAAALGHEFIPNDTVLNDDQSVWIITGPNMGGKSTYLRQVALISLMAHMGMFVPAKSAVMPLLDRIFTRIGAGDNVSGGKSTFLIEMEETAAICTQATNRSLVILDEVGRGTSTYDGLAIAQAVVEHLHAIKARCLFATHYHELTALENSPGMVCYHAASKQVPTGILFLYKMVRGAADGSFGIAAARLAGLPAPIVARAQEILAGLGHESKDWPNHKFLESELAR